MNTKGAVGAEHHRNSARERLFTVETANGALVLVRQVAQDTVDTYRELMRLRTEKRDLAAVLDAADRLEELGTRIEQQTQRLKQLHQELLDIGCLLKDFSEGLVDFPAVLDGRKVLLCWKLGEPEVAYWHEWRAGFAGRRPIDAGFRVRIGQPESTGTEKLAPG
jgi:hypothetical protein